MTLFYTFLSAVILGSAFYVAMTSKAKTPRDGIMVVLGFATVFVLVYYLIQFMAPYFLRTAPGFTQRQFDGVFSGQQYQDITEQIGNTLQGADPLRASINSGSEQYTYADLVTPTPAISVVATAEPVYTDNVQPAPAPSEAAPEAAPAPTPIPTATPDPQVTALVQDLYAYKEVGNVAAGEQVIEQILALDPGNPDAMREQQSITAARGIVGQWDQLGYRQGGQRSRFNIRDGADISSYLSGFTYRVEVSADAIGLSTEAEEAVIVVTSPGWLFNYQIRLARIHLVNLGAPNVGDIIDMTGGR